MTPPSSPDDRLPAETSPTDLQHRTDGELLEGLAVAADQRRAEATCSHADPDGDRDHRITDLEDALVGELRSRRPSG